MPCWWTPLRRVSGCDCSRATSSTATDGSTVTGGATATDGATADGTTVDAATSTSDAGTEVQSHSDGGSSPLADTGAGVGGLSVLGGLLFFVRRLLRIG